MQSWVTVPGMALTCRPPNVISISVDMSLLKGRREKQWFPPAFDTALCISCTL